MYTETAIINAHELYTIFFLIGIRFIDQACVHKELVRVFLLSIYFTEETPDTTDNSHVSETLTIVELAF